MGKDIVMKRIFLAGAIIGAALIGLAGCKSGKGVNELALEHLERKYGEKFEYSAPAGMSYSGTRAFTATCESFGDKKILVEIENYTDEEKRVFRDSYIAQKYEEQVKELFVQLSNEVFGESRVFYLTSGRAMPADMPPDASFEEFLTCTDGMLLPNIVLPESSYENDEQFAKLSDKITSTFSCDELDVRIMVVNDDLFKTVDMDKFNDIFLVKSGVAHAQLTRYKGEVKLEIYDEEGT